MAGSDPRLYQGHSNPALAQEQPGMSDSSCLTLCILETSKGILWQTVNTQMKCTGLKLRVCTPPKKKKKKKFSTKTYVVGTQKNRLNETVLLFF